MDILGFTCFVEFVRFKKNDDDLIKRVLKNKIQVGVAVDMVCENTWIKY